MKNLNNQPKLTRPNFRIVEYFGEQLQLDNYLYYITINKDGRCIAWFEEPHIWRNCYGEKSEWINYRRSEFLGYFDLNGYNWEDTLRHFPRGERNETI